MMNKLHSGLTVCVEVKYGDAGNLKKLLKQLNSNKQNGFDLTQSGTTLFASGIVLPKEIYGKEELPETFVLATTYCGPLAAHLWDLITACKTGLCQLFSHCAGFPEGDITSNEQLLRYIKAHCFSGAFNSRNNGMSKKDITAEKKLRNEIENYIDRLKKLVPLPGAIAIQQLIQRHIKSLGSDYAWVYKPAK